MNTFEEIWRAAMSGETAVAQEDFLQAMAAAKSMKQIIDSKLKDIKSAILEQHPFKRGQIVQVWEHDPMYEPGIGKLFPSVKKGFYRVHEIWVNGQGEVRMNFTKGDDSFIHFLNYTKVELC